MPKVSVCIPAYNQPVYLKRTIDSVLTQTYRDFEIIITDDSPGDEIKNLIGELSDKEKIVYIKNERPLGSPANWNFGISKARGEYIKVLHHDDYLNTKTSLGDFVQALDDNPASDFAFSQTTVHNEQDGVTRIHAISEKQFRPIRKNPELLILGNIIGAPSATIYRKNNILFDLNLKWLVDVDFYINLLKKNSNAVLIGKSLITTTDGAAHQVTGECLNNPDVELKEFTYEIEKFSFPKDKEKIFVNFFLSLFHRYNISAIGELKSFAPFINKEIAFFQTVMSRYSSYSPDKNTKTKLKSTLKKMFKNRVTLFLYGQYKQRQGYSKYKKQLQEFKESAAKAKARFDFNSADNYVCLNDDTANTGFDRHYLYHLSWAIRVVKEINPAEHVDIASLLYFPALLSAFVKVKYYDYRPAQLDLDNLTSGKGDLTGLPFADNSVMSLSCMHTVEHIGLGRYGDPIDYDGDLKAIKELKRVVAKNGNLLFVVPIGKSRIQFNAHRIYSYSQVLDYFDGFELKEFALIPDSSADGGLVRNAAKELSDKQWYACGCFWLVKK